MDKIKASLFPALVKEEPVYVSVGDITYAIERKVSIEEIINGSQWVINGLVDDSRPFISYQAKMIMKNFGLVKIFTNIDIDEVEGAEIYSIYDSLVEADVINQIKRTVSSQQISFYEEAIEGTLKSIMEYKTSAAGILDTITSQAQASTAAMKENLEIVGDANNLQQVKKLIETAEGLGYNPA